MKRNTIERKGAGHHDKGKIMEDEPCVKSWQSIGLCDKIQGRHGQRFNAASHQYRPCNPNIITLSEGGQSAR
jgi:hypothetical protein